MREMYKHIEESNLIEGITDPKEIKQSFIAWDWLHDWNMPLTHSAICKVQKIITLRQTDLRPDQRGYYRDLSHTNVRVGNHIPPSWQYVHPLMADLLLTFDNKTPWENHVQFEYIHPFVDGNGRTGRMLMWWQEVKSGQKPTLIKSAERFEYYRRLDESRAKKSTG